MEGTCEPVCPGPNRAPRFISLLETPVELFVVVIIGAVDYATGYEVSFSIFYLIPVTIAAWRKGFRHGSLISFLSAATWLFVDLIPSHHYSHAIIPYWNASVRLGFFLGFTYLVDQQKKASGLLRKANDELDGRVRIRTAELRDSNECLRAELAARTRLALAVEQAAESIVITDPQANIVYVNPAFERLTGYGREEVLGKNPRILKSGHQSAEFYQEMWQALTHGQAWSGRIVNQRKDGTLFEEEAAIAPVHDETGELVNYVAVKRDVTRERQLEDQVRQMQKMEAVGQLAGGIAHDFNNLLTVITGYGQLLRETLEPTDPRCSHLGEILKAGDRAASLTRQLLAFSRRQVLAPQVLDLNAVVKDMDKMLKRIIGEDIELVMRPGDTLGSVKADPSQIEQVILNLAVNARDAMPTGGKLTIETQNIDLDETYTRVHATVTPGPHVMLAVTDTGVGMDADTQAHIFEPFFTTKPKGKGTGLGLATVYGIVKQSGGHIWVYSEPAHGTTFKVYLPRIESRTSVVKKAASTASLEGTETILLVEDAPAVRTLARDVLESKGYRVLVASGPAEAVRISDEFDGTIHLLLTDVVMPTMGGRQLAEHLAFSRPQMKVLYTSGYTDDTIVRHGVLNEGIQFLQKPFNPEGLARKVSEVLSSG